MGSVPILVGSQNWDLCQPCARSTTHFPGTRRAPCDPCARAVPTRSSRPAPGRKGWGSLTQLQPRSAPASAASASLPLPPEQCRARPALAQAGAGGALPRALGAASSGWDPWISWHSRGGQQDPEGERPIPVPFLGYLYLFPGHPGASGASSRARVARPRCPSSTETWELPKISSPRLCMAPSSSSFQAQGGTSRKREAKINGISGKWGKSCKGMENSLGVSWGGRDGCAIAWGMASSWEWESS